MLIGEEKWQEFWPEAEPLFALHQLELTNEPLDVDFELAERLCAAGAMIVVSARESGLLVGYCLFYLSPALEQRGTLVATQGPWYVAREWRRGPLGLRLFKEALRVCKARGASRAFAHFWSRSDPRLAGFFLRLGGHLTETTYSIPLTPKGSLSGGA